MANYIATTEQFTATANAIRAKTGSSGSLEWDANTGYADDIAAIPSGGGSAFPVYDVPVFNPSGDTYGPVFNIGAYVHTGELAQAISDGDIIAILTCSASSFSLDTAYMQDFELQGVDNYSLIGGANDYIDGIVFSNANCTSLIVMHFTEYADNSINLPFVIYADTLCQPEYPFIITDEEENVATYSSCLSSTNAHLLLIDISYNIEPINYFRIYFPENEQFVICYGEIGMTWSEWVNSRFYQFDIEPSYFISNLDPNSRGTTMIENPTSPNSKILFGDITAYYYNGGSGGGSIG